MRHRGRGAALVVAESVSVAPFRSARQGVGAVVATVLGYPVLSDLACCSIGCLGDDVDEVRLQRFRKLEAFFTQQNANPRVGSAARTPTSNAPPPADQLGRASARRKWHPLYDVRPSSRKKPVAPHYLYLPYRPSPEVGPTKARDLPKKPRREQIGEPSNVGVRQVAGRGVDEPFAARLANASVRYPSEVPAKRTKRSVVRNYFREDRGGGEVEPPHGEVEPGVRAHDKAQLGETVNDTGVVGRRVPQLTDGHVHGLGRVVMVVSVVLTQPFEGGDHRRRHARRHPDDRRQMHGGVRTQGREFVGNPAGGDTQPRTAREPRYLKAGSLTKYQSFYFSLALVAQLDQRSPNSRTSSKEAEPIGNQIYSTLPQVPSSADKQGDRRLRAIGGPRKCRRGGSRPWSLEGQRLPRLT